MNDALEPINRPALTMPIAEARILHEAYEAADVIYEYGAGGSTVLAAEMRGKQIYCVETDELWVNSMQSWFKQNPPLSEVDIIWANIGKTRAWGRPANENEWREFSKYPLEIWDLTDIPHPDVVLVDGRFRAACVLATAFRCSQPVRVLVDDYTQRATYHVVEKYVGAPRITGRLAEFNITPTAIDATHLLEIISIMQDPY